MKTLFQITFLAILLASQNPLAAQTKTDSIKQAGSEVNPSNRMYFEILGNGLVYSVNFERQLPRSYGSFGFRLGAGYTDADDLKLFAIPVGINMVSERLIAALKQGSDYH